MRQIQVATRIDAPAPLVWQVLTDVEAYPSWNPLVVHLSGELQEGARLNAQIALPGRRPMTFRPTVQRVISEQLFRWKGHLLVPGLFDGTHQFEVVPVGPSEVEFVHSEQFEGLLVPLVWRSLEAPTRAGFEAMNEALKVRVEKLFQIMQADGSVVRVP